jgi:hypothetical protein
MPSELRVSVGIFSIAIVTDDERVSRQLSNFYYDFLTDQPPILTVRTRVGKGEGDIPTVPRVRPEKIEFDEEGYRGEIDWQTKDASLVLNVKNPLFGVDYFVRVATAVAAFHCGGLMIHAAGVEHNRSAYLFLGYSGAGKTTTARNSPAGLVLNDDLLVIYAVRGQWYAAATPFYNPTQNRPRPGKAPIARVLYLVKDKNVYLEEVPQAQALAEMVACVPVLTAEPCYLREILNRSRQILDTVPYHHLHLLPDDSYWSVLLDET